MTIERVVAIQSQLVTEDAESLEPRIALTTAYVTLGQLYSEQPAEWLQALAAYDQAIELLEAMTQEHPELAEQSYQLASKLSDVSSIKQKLGQTESAVENLRKALLIFERIDQLYPGAVLYQQGLGTAYNMMSDLDASGVSKPRLLPSPKKHACCSNPW